jgi:hypothetical protein
VVYLGTEGLESCLKIQKSESPEEDVLSTAKCLVASFEDRKFLQKTDHEVIKRLGLRFRGGCPFFPVCFLIVDHDSGFVFESHLESKDRHRPEFQNHMLKVIEKNAYLPQEIWVKREEVFQLFEVLVSRLSLKMKQVKKLNQLESAQKSMKSFLSSGKM